MHRVVPDIIVENYRAGHYSGEFPAVGMFLDLSGFSFMTDALMQHGQHGAEVLAGLMHGVFDPLVESIFYHGGRIVGFAGDGIIALYPIESDPRRTALRALASAHGVQSRLVEKPTRSTVYGTFPISARIGLTCGSTTWGILRSQDGQDATYYFRGSAVDESVRAEQHAGAGEIFIAPPLQQVVQADITAEPAASLYRFTGFQTAIPGPGNVSPRPLDVDVARRFMPEDVIVHDVRGEFRQIVNLFMRFPDLSDESLRDLLSVVFELRRKYGGLVSRLDFGDKGCNLLILWGAPVSYENDIGRALNFVLDLKSRIDVPITAGVTYYVAHAGYLGSSMFEDYTCYGWGVNLASRFMMTAQPGSIWVDDRIARRVAKRFDLEFVRQQVFKGFKDPQRVHLLRGHKEIDEAIYEGELVGRERELEHLGAFAEPLRTGEFAGLAFVVGDAGIGKGRLIHEFRYSEFFEGTRVLWAVCQSRQILRQSFNPLRSWLLRYFGITQRQTQEQRRHLFDSRLEDLLASLPVAELARELRRTRSLIASLVDVYWPDSLFEKLDAEGRYNITFVALISLLKAESLRQPVILFLEDLQFTDADTRDFLARLRRSLLADSESYPIAIIVTSRPQADLEPDLVDASIRLRGLSYPAVGRLVENLLGDSAAPSLVSFVMGKSEGNPFFTEEIVRYLRDRKMLETSAAGWQMVDALDEAVLPGDVRSVLVARLDQLSREVRTTVHTASVLGREFEVRVLARMLGDSGTVHESVAEAEKAAIWTPLGGTGYVFSHGLLRDAAYSMQMRARRQELHGLAVDALESIYAEEPRWNYPEIAYHAEQAHLTEKARQYYTLAGRAASQLFQNRQGIDYYTRALAFTPASDHVSRFELLLERTELFNRLGDRPSQLHDLNLLETTAQQLHDPDRMAKVEMLYAHYFVSIGDYPAVLRHSDRVMGLAGSLKDPDVVLDTYRVWPLALLRQGKFAEAMRIAQEGRNLARSSGDAVREGYILNSMGLIAIEQKDPAVANGFLEQALLIAREIGDSRLELRSLLNLGNFTGFVHQDYALASQYFKAGQSLAHERGERAQESTALGNLGWAAGMQGDFEAARSNHERALVLSREVGNSHLEANTLINLSFLSSLTNEPQNSLDFARRALDICRISGDRSGEAWSTLYMGYAYLLLAQVEQAAFSFRQSIGIRRELGQAALEAESRAGLIHAHLQGGDLAAATEETENILTYLRDGGTLDGTEERLRIYHACYITLRRARDIRARVVLHQAAELLASHLSRLREEHARRMYVEGVPWRLAIRQAAQEDAD